ncbi:MAG: tRNA (adenosine(37)-N6)-threonylcarbamoyltransferase complex dimerization subunit type 1 TsaB, partial [Chloroflexi bacterium]|nr:tRNA (adenosine(37)-N6)-threonylcarbamoyltransferase complex dimerization subunit type 1 TsaB [Chloroflexota bacterium]
MATDRPILAIDTATSVALVATGDPSGRLRRESAWTAGFRHGEELLSRVVDLLAADGLRHDDLGAVVVGTGPGAFTGLRIGLATAKTLAHELDVPIVGVSTAAALADAARSRGAGRGALAVLLPAGPSGVVVVEFDTTAAKNGAPGAAPRRKPRLVTGGASLDLDPGATVLAVDLETRAAS